MKYNIGNKVLIKSDIEPLFFSKEYCGKVYPIIGVTYNGATPVYVIKATKRMTISYTDTVDEKPKEITIDEYIYVCEEEVEKLIEGCKKPLSYEPTDEDVLLINYAYKFGYKYIVPLADGKGMMFKTKPIQERKIHLNAGRNYWISCDNEGFQFLLPKHLSFQTNDDIEPYCIEEHLERIKRYVKVGR